MCNANPESQITKEEILVWLPSPMGDGILCTPALRAIRKYFKFGKITFFTNPVVRQILSPCNFNDEWLEQKSNNPLAIAKQLKEHKFTHAILFKNSFASALAVLLARIPTRIGYAREGRGFLLTDKLYPAKLPGGKFKPISMVDYYLAIASWLGCETNNRNLELQIDSGDEQCLCGKLPQVLDLDGPLVVLVPGGAFGPSK
ncbi:MAG: glycosyltransferase family 9 protein, partial [Phycisphaerales bacterium]